MKEDEIINEENSEERRDIYPPFVYTFGRPPKYTVKQVAEKFAEYVEWMNAHPYEIETIEKGMTEKGIINKRKVERRARLLTVQGFVSFIGMTREWWKELDNAKTQDFLPLKAKITDFIEKEQLSGASAGLFKENIVSRLLGLKDKQEIEATGNGVTIVVKNDEEAAKISNIGNIGV